MSNARENVDKLRNARSVAEFGVVGDGSTNDAAALQAAITACVASGQALHIPRTANGYYCGTTKLTIAGGIKIFGDGASNLVWANTLTTAAIEITSTYVILEDIVLQTPTRGSAPGSGVIAINAAKAHLTLRNVRTESTGALAYQGWYIGVKFAEWTHMLYGCTITAHLNAVWGNAANAILMHGGSYGAGLAGVGQTILISGGSGHALIGADVEGAAAAGVYLSDGGGASSGQGTMAIHGCYFEGATDNIYILGSAGPGKDVRGVSIAGNFFNGLTTSNSAITANRVNGLDIAGNNFINHLTYGVDIGAVADNVFLHPSNVFISSEGGWAARRINSAAKGIFADTANGKLNVQNYAITLNHTAAGMILGTDAASYATIQGGDAALKGAGILLAGQSHATLPREGKLFASADGSSIYYAVRWGSDGAPKLGFYNTAPIAKQTGVAVDAAGIHAALVALGLIAA